MKPALFVVLLISISSIVPAQSWQKLHSGAIVVDTHNDILTTALTKGYSFDNNLAGKTHSDLTRWKTGGIDVQIFSICNSLPFNYQRIIGKGLFQKRYTENTGWKFPAGI